MVKDKINFLLFSALACFWSGSFVGIKIVVNEWPSLFGAAIRVGLALVCILIFMLCTKRSMHIPLKLCWKVWITGLFSLGIPFCFLFLGEKFIAPGLAGIINGTVSLWAFILTLIFLPSSCSNVPQKSIGLLLGIVGIIIIFWPMLAFKGKITEIWGALSVFAMALAYAIGAVLNQYFLANKIKIDFFANVFHQYCASMVFLIVISLLFEQWPNVSGIFMNKPLLLAIIYLGVLSTAIAFIIYCHLIREWDAVRASAVMYVVPILALFWDFLFFGDRPQLNEIIGVVAILGGVILIQFPKVWKWILRDT